MSTPGKLAVLAFGTAAALAFGSGMLSPRPAPDYTADSPYPESTWEFVIYEEDGSISVMDYNLSLWDCMERIEQSHAQSKACEREVVIGSLR